MRLLAYILALVFWTSTVDGYRFLAVFPFHGKSHFMMFEHLMKGLARKGHQVDVISPFPLKKPYANYTDLIVVNPPGPQLVNNMTYDFMREMSGFWRVTWTVSTLGGNTVCEYLSDPRILKLVQNPPNDPPYDLVFIEVFGAHCFAIIGHQWNVPVVGVSSAVLYPWAKDIVATPQNFAIAPNTLVNYPERMNFWQRAWNTVSGNIHKMSFNYWTSVQTEIIRKHFGADAPTVRELENSIAMILENSNIAINGISPRSPAVIDVGGLHVHDDGPEIPEDLKKWLDESKNGFIYFSFGSMVKIESFPRPFLDMFFRSLAKISPVRVLMKVANSKELPFDLPNNIRTSSWLSQIKVLKHPNVKAFITHGGLMGTQEAIHCGVPMIGIPLFADQFINIDNYARKKIALKVDYEKFSEQHMDDALNAILKDPIYRKTARVMAAKFSDRPLSPIDTAAYWTEYIVKYGKNALRSPAMDLTWWQVELFDVYALLILLGLTGAYVVVALAQKILNIIFAGAESAVTYEKKIR